MKIKIIASILSAVWVLMGTTVVSAHHSAAPFNFSSLVQVEGVVKEINIRNPHSEIILQVTDAERGTRDIEFEGMSASIFYRAGYTIGSVNQEDVIKLMIAPRHDSSDGGFVMSFITANGENFGFRRP